MGFLMDVFVASFAIIKPQKDDDGVDRLHYFVTANMLVGLSVLTGYKMFSGKPTRCIEPDHFRDHWMDYVDNYCWAQGTYFISDARKEPPAPWELMKSHKDRVSYYQWVPFFLVFEALCFCLPRLFWNFCSHGSGMRISDIVDLSREKTNFKPEVRKNTIKILTSHFENALKFHRRIERRGIRIYRNIFRPLNLKYSACYVTTIYLFTKVLFFANALIQFRLMNVFLFADSHGLEHISNMIKHRPWNTTGIFPRVTYCIVQTRSVASRVQNHTIQCVLMINLFNEKIFFFLWFWYLFLMIFTAASGVYWTMVLLIPQFARNYIVRHLKLADTPFSVREHQKHVNRFVSKYLQQDGVLALRMVSLHTGVIFATDLVLQLWNEYFGFEYSRTGVMMEEDFTGKPDGTVEFLKLSKNKNSKKGVKGGTDETDNKKDTDKKKDKDDTLDFEMLNIAALDRPLDKLAAMYSPPRPLNFAASAPDIDSSSTETEDDAEAFAAEKPEKKKQDRHPHQQQYQQHSGDAHRRRYR